MFGVETYSFLPYDQSNGCNLACQGQTRHGRLHPFGNESLVKLLERPLDGRGTNGRTLEECEVVRNVELVRQALANRGFRNSQLHIYT